MKRTIRRTTLRVFFSVRVNTLKRKPSFERQTVRRKHEPVSRHTSLLCSAQCRRELEEEGDMNEEEILRETANIR